MLAAIFMVFLVIVVAFAVDFGHVLVAQTELQRSADAAAHAAALEFCKPQDTNTAVKTARTTAAAYAMSNQVLHAGSTLDANWNNADRNGDVVVGQYDFATRTMTTGDVNAYNAVRVRIRRNSAMNGEIPLFFARVLGHGGLPIEAEATAAVVKDVGGFRVPGSGETVPFLPITVELDHWYEALSAMQDNWTWDPVSQTASNLSDGIPEVNIYPDSVERGNRPGNGDNDDNNTGAGNFGTVNIGTDNNAASHLGDIIRNGLTQEHLDFHGGQLAMDENGELKLGGDPGISTSISDDLAAIIGKPVAIPLYESVSGTGNNAVFTIVKFVGVRLVEVDMHGSSKTVIAQPADVSFRGVVASQGGGGFYQSSEQIFSPVAIVD